MFVCLLHIHATCFYEVLVVVAQKLESYTACALRSASRVVPVGTGSDK